MKLEINIPRIYTGSFHKLDKYREAELTLVSAAYNKPDVDDVKVMNVLAPEKELLCAYRAGEVDWLDYDLRYRTQIAKSIDLKMLVTTLSCLACIEQTKGIILLTYEKQSVKSHRSILGDLLNKSGLIDIAVEEYKYR